MQHSTSNQRNQPPADDYVAGLFAQLDRDRTAAGLNLLAFIYAEHLAGARVAREEGVSQHVFDDDARILFLAADVGERLDRDALFHFARTALQHYGWWDADQIAVAGESSFWSAARLSAFRASCVPSELATRQAARRLLSIDWRWRRAQAGLRDLLTTLEDREFDVIDRPRARPLPAVVVRAVAEVA